MDNRRLIRRITRVNYILNRTILRRMINITIMSRRLNSNRTRINGLLRILLIIMFIILCILYVMYRVRLTTRITILTMRRRKSMTQNIRDGYPSLLTLLLNHLYHYFRHQFKRALRTNQINCIRDMTINNFRRVLTGYRYYLTRFNDRLAVLNFILFTRINSVTNGTIVQLLRRALLLNHGNTLINNLMCYLRTNGRLLIRTCIIKILNRRK